MQEVKLAVVGVGALGKHHARILSGLDGVRLVAVAELNATAGRDVAEKCGTRWVADYREILEEIDAAVIAVPTFAHLKVAGDFLQRGIPVLVEKPLASDPAQARQLVELAAKQKTLLQVGHVERFNPAMAAARQFLVGPKYIRSERYSPYAFRSTDIGVVHDVMIHDIDLVLSCAEAEVERVEAFGTSILGGHEDCVQARITFADGCVADLAANRISPVQRRNMQVWTPNGCVNIDFAARQVSAYQPGDALKQGTSPLDLARQPGANIEQLKTEMFGTFIKVTQPTIPAADALTEELRSFLDCLRTGSSPQVGGREALAAMDVADKILSQVAARRWDLPIAGKIGPAAPAEERKRAG